MPAASQTPATPVTVYVIRARWHTAVGFAVDDLTPPLSPLRAALPSGKYLLFGFGDRQYLLGRGPEASELIAALWPGAGVLMLTGLPGSPDAAYGASNVIRLRLRGAQARDLEMFIWASLEKPHGEIAPLNPGPYAETLYYASTLRYSALYTCNTWTADALGAATLPVHGTGVAFAGQVWAQVRRLPSLR